jgi:uncharacterized protein (TIGR03437 family)
MVFRHSLIGLSLALACSTGAWAQQYTISTVAGNNTQGFAGDGGAPSSAEFFLPVRIVLGSSGSIYIADGGNERIRMISGGSITTIAGDGTVGYTGDGAAATKAELSDPTGIALDSSGNLYIADASNNVVRVVTSGGTISTFAGTGTIGYIGDGGTAVTAELNNPVAVAVDSSGDVFIADAGNNVVRKVVSGTIYTVVGGASTDLQLSQPDGLAIDSKGVLYIADTGNRRIIKFENGVLFVIAGNGNFGASGDGGPAVDAGLGDPMGLAADGAGNLYIADTLDSLIRKISPDGTISTIAGDGIEAYFGDGGPATKAALFFPHDVTVDSSGNVYVADTMNNVVRLLKTAPPSIFTRGIVNSANFKAQVSPGALASVFGTGFAGQNAAASLPLSTTLTGVSVTVDGKAAPLTYVAPGQVNFQVPWETALGTASVTVTMNGQTSAAVSVPVLTAAPGLFSVQNSNSQPNSAGNPAKVGSNITAYLSGSGPVSPPVADGAVSPNPAAVLTSAFSATIGSESAPVSFAGLAPGFVGLVQMNITVPSTLATGSYPLAITIAGETSNPETISVTQ